MDKIMKRQNGITLVVLIVSIIVMLILAGVVIMIAVGDNGLIKKTRLAVVETERADIQDVIIGSYIFEKTASNNNFAYIDIDKTGISIYDNLTASGFTVLEPVKVPDENGNMVNSAPIIKDENENSTGIEVTVRGEYGEYTGTLDNSGLVGDVTVEKNFMENQTSPSPAEPGMSDLEKLKKYFDTAPILKYTVGNDGPVFDDTMLLNIELDDSGNPTTLEFKGNSVLPEDEAKLIEFDKESFISDIFNEPSEFIIKYKEIDYIVEFNREIIEINENEATVKITAITVEFYKELTIKEQLEKIVLNQSLTNLNFPDNGIEFKDSEEADQGYYLFIVGFKGEVFGLIVDTTTYEITEVKESDWKPFGDENDYFLVEKSGSNVKITGLTEKGKQDVMQNHKLNIPSKILSADGTKPVAEYPVIGIKDNSFQDVLTAVHTLTFDKDIKVDTINSATFSGMENLIGTLRIPSSVVTIGSHAFNGTSITKLEFEENSNLKTIGDYSFSTKENTLTGELIIPASVETIGKCAFWNSSITNLIFEEGSKLKIVKYMAFHNCTSLSNAINIPSTCETLEEYAFANSGITGVKFNGAIRIEEFAFYNCGALTGELYLYDGTYLAQNCFYASYNNFTKISTSPDVISGEIGLSTTFIYYKDSKWFIEYRGTFEEFRTKNIVDKGGRFVVYEVKGLKVETTDGTYVHGVDFEWN